MSTATQIPKHLSQHEHYVCSPNSNNNFKQYVKQDHQQISPTDISFKLHHRHQQQQQQQRAALLPSAFELTPPDSQSRKRAYNGDDETHNNNNNAYYSIVPITPQSQPHHQQVASNSFITPNKRVMLYTPQAASHYPPNQVRHGPTPPNTSSVAANSTNNDVFSSSSAPPVNDMPAYMGYLQRQKKDRGDETASVWNNEVEEAFMEAVRKIPRVGRRKITIHGRPCGRNELISDYIYQKTGILRTRKQVSSHIQVLKHLLKDDEEFMSLVSDTPSKSSSTQAQYLPHVISPIFSKNSAGLREQEERRMTTGATEMFISPKYKKNRSTATTNDNDAYYRPYSYPPLPRSMSVVNSGPPIHQPTYHTNVNNNNNDKDIGFCPLNFCMWNSETQQVYSQLIRPQFEMPLRPTKGIANVAERFPKVASLLQSGKTNCPIIYGKVKLSVGNTNNNGLSFDKDFKIVVEFSNQTIASSPFNQDTFKWQVVTSINTMGHDVLDLYENIHVSQNLAQRMDRLSIPFAGDFWAAFVSGFKQPQSEEDAETAITAITVTQKLYCRRKIRSNVGLLHPSDDNENDCEDLKAIIIYEFEKAKDAFDARTIFRRLILPEPWTYANPHTPPQYEQPVPPAQPVQTTVYGSPLPKRALDVSAVTQEPSDSNSFDFNFPEPVTMARSFSAAGFQHHVTPQQLQEASNNNNHHNDYLVNEANSIGMTRSLTAFTEPVNISNPWTDPFMSQAIISEDSWYNEKKNDNNRQDSQATIEETSNNSNKNNGTNTIDEDKKSNNLHIDAIPFSSVFDSIDQPLKSAPPSFGYRSFEEDGGE